MKLNKYLVNGMIKVFARNLKYENTQTSNVPIEIYILQSKQFNVRAKI